MKLAEWFDLPNPDGSRKRKDAFAKDIGVTPQIISAYCAGSMWPGRKRMEKIIEVTEGAVTANDFIEMPSEVAS